MNGIDLNLTDILPAFIAYRILFGALGAAILYDYACLVGNLDGPNVSLFFKAMVVWMAFASAGMLFFSISGDEKWMSISGLATIAGYSMMRLWTWLKGVYLSDLAKMK